MFFLEESYKNMQKIHILKILRAPPLFDNREYAFKLSLHLQFSLVTPYGAIQEKYLFELFGIPKKFKNLYFEKIIPLSAESFTWYVRIPIWITIVLKLDFFKIEGASHNNNWMGGGR